MTLKNTINNIKNSNIEYFNIEIVISQVNTYNGYDFDEWVFNDVNFTPYDSRILKDFIKKEGLKVKLIYQYNIIENCVVIKNDLNEVSWTME
jgi:hypothetical protein